MKVSIQQHRNYLATQFDQATELPKILNWTDREWSELYLPWLKDTSPNKMTEDELCWKWLVTMFVKLPDGKKTKAYVYQMMVLNDLANDGLNGKKHCWRRHRDCITEQRWLERLSRDWQESDLQNLCGNLAICIRQPDPKLFPFDLNFSESLREITIDDRILKRK